MAHQHDMNAELWEACLRTARRILSHKRDAARIVDADTFAADLYLKVKDDPEKQKQSSLTRVARGVLTSLLRPEINYRRQLINYINTASNNIINNAVNGVNKLTASNNNNYNLRNAINNNILRGIINNHGVNGVNAALSIVYNYGNTLAKKEDRLVFLTLLQRLEVKDAAWALGLSRTTVWRRRARMIKTLRRLLSEKFSISEP